MTTITKAQILKLAEAAKAKVREQGGSFSAMLENMLLAYSNVYRTEMGNILVRLNNGTHVDLFTGIINPSKN